MAQGAPFTVISWHRKSWLSTPSTFFQLSPPSSLTSRLSSAVIQPRLELSKRMEVSDDFNGLVCAVHVAPPSRLRRICPLNPTLQPLFASRKYTEVSDPCAAALRTGCQFLPPSVVRRIMPAQPTAQPRSASRKKTFSNDSLVPVVCGAQVAPPSAESRMTPSYPVTQPDWPTNWMAVRLSVTPVFRGSQVFPPPAVATNSPSSPTAKPWFASENSIFRRCPFAPVLRLHQVVPASVVTIKPPCSQSR